MFDRHVTGEALSGLGLALLLNLQLLATAQYSKVKVSLEIDLHHPPFGHHGRLYYNFETYRKIAS